MKIIDGLKSNFKALPFMARNGMLIWFLPATVLTIVMSYASFVLIDWVVDYASFHYLKFFDLSENLLEDESDGFFEIIKNLLITAGEYSLKAILWVVLFIIKLKLMKYIVIAFLGPIMAALSEIAENKLTGVKKQFTFKRWVFEIMRGFRTAILYLFIELSTALLLLLFFAILGFFIPVIIPVIAIFEIILTFFIGAFFYGAAALDYVWEREGVGALGSLRKAISNSSLAIGVGVPFAIWMMIPIINFTIAPIFAPAIASVSAVLSLKTQINKK
ncbi:MAG: hypothetical protein COA49_08335 [Bacteroidetes bacterium]|nr:MAG: hypothetical protein COA49_08335 [Bacteroidota bacterium]